MSNNISYFKKYLKYKKKYLDLIELIGGAMNLNMDGINRPLRVIMNTGAMNEHGINYRNRCMFISILDYLRRNGYPDLTLSILRHQAGVGMHYYRQEWDQGRNIHVRALEILCEIYNLDISIWNIGANGLLDQTMINAPGEGYPAQLNPRYRVGFGGANIVNIASYGRHFQLIVGGGIFEDDVNVQDGIIYQPHVPNSSKNGYVLLSSLEDNQQSLMKMINEMETLVLLKNLLIEDITS